MVPFPPTPPMGSLRVAVVGGGAAGILAAWKAASMGHRTLLLEANPRLGMKVRISGGGRCNVTHQGPVEALLKAFPPAQARFLKPSLHAFPNDRVVELLRGEGVDTRARENGRVFPLGGPGSAQRVVEALEALLARAGAEVRFGARVAALEGRRPRLEALRLESGERLEADLFILATGGASYPRTGTRGECLAWLEALGVPVAPWFPALAPIPLQRPRPAWEGVALRGGRLLLKAGPQGRLLQGFRGDLLFTRGGVSGPAALELSQAAEAARREGGAWLAYALEEDGEALDRGLQEEQRRNPHLAARSWLQRWVPERLGPPLMREAGIPEDQRLKDLPRGGRRALVDLVTGLPLGEPGAVDLERGEVCAGGVRLDAVDPRTLKVKGWDNLKVCGELLDLNGPVGGYNLQAAFSTGASAGTISPGSA